MAFNTAPGRAEYTASAGQTIFTFNFKIYVDTDIKVYQTISGAIPDDTADLLVKDTDYTVVVTGDTGGTVTLLTGATLNDTITIKRELPITRTIEYQTSGDLLAETLNGDQDYQTYLLLDQDTLGGRYLKLPDTAQNVSNDVPNPEALYSMRWNSAGTALENVLIAEGSVTLDTVETMTDLLTLTPSTDTVSVQGYYAKSDGGGGLFNYITTVDKATANGGTIIDPSVSLANQGTGVGLGCWVRQYSGATNVRWFGAKGDGVTDDVLPIQAAIDYAKDIYVPEGIFFLSGRLNLTNGQTFRGSSITDTKFKVDYIQFMRIGDGDNYSRSVVENFTVLANQVTTDPTSYGIFHDITNYAILRNSALIQNIVMRGSDDLIISTLGFRVNFKFSNSYGPEMNYLRIEGTYNPNLDPATQNDTYGVVLENQTIATLMDHCNFNAVKEGITVTASTAEGVYVDNCEMVGCRIGISAAQVLGVNITNSHFNTVKYGYFGSNGFVHLISNTSFYSTLAFFDDGDYFGISADTINKLMINNVQVQDQDAAVNTNKCVFIESCTSVAMNGLTLSGQGYGIYLGSSNSGVNIDTVAFDAVDTAYFIVSDDTNLNINLGNHTFIGSVVTRYDMQNRTHLTVKENSLRNNGYVGNATISTTTNKVLVPNVDGQTQEFSLSNTGVAYQLNITFNVGTGRIAGVYYEFKINLPSQITATVVFFDKDLNILHTLGTATAGSYYAKVIYDGTGLAHIVAIHEIVPTL